MYTTRVIPENRYDFTVCNTGRDSIVNLFVHIRVAYYRLMGGGGIILFSFLLFLGSNISLL